MRTYVYIDGFNLYHRALQNTPHKWLDLKEMVRRIIPPGYSIERIKYFTALIKPTVSDPRKLQRQEIYLRALEAFLPEIEIFYGQFKRREKRGLMVGGPCPGQLVTIKTMEEKGSDVNLGVHMVHDAAQDIYDCAAVVSNDSDLKEAFKIVKAHYIKNVFAICPDQVNPLVNELRQHASDVRYIQKRTLSRSQLPSFIPNTRIHKPSSW